MTSYLWYFMFNFFLYGMIGWIIEEIYCFAVTGHFQEDGFLYGPFKPMYAIAMSILILLQDTFINSMCYRTNDSRIFIRSFNAPRFS